jgi:hypothetical protein
MDKILIVIFIFLLNTGGNAQTDSRFYIDGGLIISHFQQQVKQEVGDPRGERLVHESEIGFLISGRYSVNDHLSAGIFLRADFGKREAALFDGFDSEGKTVIKNKVGGNYTEVWFGPEVIFHWKQLFAELGYGLIGIRNDYGRTDIPSSTGDTSGSFTTKPSIAWLISVGGYIPVFDKMNVLLKLEYRVRYYDERGGSPLINQIDHGTQSISPIIGVSWNLL